MVNITGQSVIADRVEWLCMVATCGYLFPLIRKSADLFFQLTVTNFASELGVQILLSLLFVLITLFALPMAWISFKKGMLSRAILFSFLPLSILFMERIIMIIVASIFDYKSHCFFGY